MKGKFENSFYEASISLVPTPGNDPTKKETYRSISLMKLDATILKRYSQIEFNNTAKILNKILTN